MSEPQTRSDRAARREVAPSEPHPAPAVGGGCCGAARAVESSQSDCCGPAAPAPSPSPSAEASCGCEGGCEGETAGGIPWTELRPIAIATLLLAAGLVFQEPLQATPGGWGEYAVLLPAYLLSGWGVLMAAGRNLLRGRAFDENFLMTVATLGAIAIRALPEAVAVMLFFQTGEFVQGLAVGRSRRSIRALLEVRPDRANLWVGDELREVSPETVAVGQAIAVRPGEKIPLDGEVIRGRSRVDAAALTGESVPQAVEPGDAVWAGCVNQGGVLTVRVTKPFGESSAAKILDLVETARSQKAETEKFITRFARYYTPVVVGLSLALALLPPLLVSGATAADWTYRALVLLVISCPCGLVISIPLGYFGGIGGAARRGILVKGSAVLDALTQVGTAAFDKTGTLTRGNFRVTEIVPTRAANGRGLDAEQLLALAARAEGPSDHPVARAIREAWAERAGSPAQDAEMAIAGSADRSGNARPTAVQIETSSTASSTANSTASSTEAIPTQAIQPEAIPTQIARPEAIPTGDAWTEEAWEEIAGCGVRARLDGQTVLVGNDRLLDREGVPYDPVAATGTVVRVALAGEALGYLAIADELKPDAAEAIGALRRAGLQTVLLTGDRRATAKAIAQTLGVDRYEAELLPEDKVAALGAIAAANPRRKLAFVGDGINDAPALARADVGIAMGGLGSDAAIETADAVLMTDAPTKVAEAIALAWRTRHIVWQNIALALGVKLAFATLGAAGAASLWEAVFADVGVALLAVLNATRVLRGADS